MPIINRLGNKFLTFIFYLLYRIPLKDSQSGMWVFKKVIWRDMHIKSDQMAFSQELKVEAIFYNKINWAEIDIPYYERLGAKKLRMIYNGLDNTINLFKKRISRHA